MLTLSFALVAFAAGCELPTLAHGETCTTSDQCGDNLACFEDEEGDATCGCADISMHDGGDGTCVSLGQCVAGFHNGGDRTCVPDDECIPGVSLVDGDCLAAASPICLQYVECVGHFDEVNGTTSTGVDEAYGNGGVCWEDADTAASCTSACTTAVRSLRDSLDAAGEQVGPCD